MTRLIVSLPVGVKLGTMHIMLRKTVDKGEYLPSRQNVIDYIQDAEVRGCVGKKIGCHTRLSSMNIDLSLRAQRRNRTK